MSEEPAAKRMKNSDEFPNLRSEVAGPVKEKLMELDAVQHQLDVMSEKAAEEILKVEQSFNKKRMPIYEKRKKLTTQIANFWQTAFLNHHLLSTAIPEEQEDLLAALRDLEVQEFEDLRSGFKIIMTFNKNDYFENETIIKSYHLQSERPSTEITEIEWKENRKPEPQPEDGDSDTTITFLEWLTYAAPPDSDEIAEVIKDDLYINPLQYYVMPDMHEVEEDDIDDFLAEERGVDERFQNGRPLRQLNETSKTIDDSLVAGGRDSRDVSGFENGENTGEEEEEEDEEEVEGEEDGEDEEEEEDEESAGDGKKGSKNEGKGE
uniref:Uncharacterized protein n=1 Tax=Caenorhabditis japonica TaxID=281687 RepID=A0A8R1DTN8_CAEJA